MDVRYRRSPIPKGGLEIPIKGPFAGGVKKNKRTRIWALHGARKYKKSEVQNEMEEQYASDTLEEFGLADGVKASQQTDVEVECIYWI